MTAMTDDFDGDAIENAEEVIKRFGGIRPMATKMEVPVTTVQGWKKRNVIPANRRDEVLEAADENDIDLGDLIGEAANENTDSRGYGADQEPEVEAVTAKEEPLELRSNNFGAVMSEEMAKPDSERENEHVHQESVMAAQKTNEAESTEAILSKIKTAEQRALQKSVLVSVSLVAITAGLMAFLFIPGAKDSNEADQRLDALETEVASVQEKQSFLDRVVPENLREELETVKAQAKSAQDTVAIIRAEAGAISQDLSDPSLSIGERLTRLEQRVETMGAPPQLADLIDKVKTLQGSVEGQEQLAKSIADLRALVEGQQATPEAMDEALAEAQTEDDALGQTLGGLSREDVKAGAMLLALTQFRGALDRNEPFATDLELMQKMLGTQDDPAMQDAINRLAPHAEDGVMSSDRLKSEFKGLAGDIVVSSLKGEDVSVRERAMARFNEILSVEKDGELITGTDTQATVARAQKLLDEGNVQGAIAELQTLEGGAKETAMPWIDEAQATLLAGQLESLFTGKVASEVSQSSLAKTASGSKLSIDQLVSELKNLKPPRKLVTDDASGFMILEPAPLDLPTAP